MPKIMQLSTHIANLIAAGEVVERPASAVKELLENAVDAGASKVTVEIQNGGMTFLRVTDNGCGMAPEDARTAFLRHATSKLRTEDDLAAIGTMGFRGEALAAIASVSRIDLMTKTPGSLSGTSLHLEAGNITEESEVGCPDGTTIIVRDLFYNTPARMKFMKADTVEGSRVAAAVQLQALAHPDVAITLVRDGKQVLSTPGTGGLEAAVYCVYGRECAHMVKVESRWESYSLTGYVSKPSDARPSRNLQTFFVNGRPVKSKMMVSALEEAYRNQIMVGKFPACVLHLQFPANAVDVNVHPAKTEVKFLQEKAVFDCIHYGVLGALNKTQDRPQVQFKPAPAAQPAAHPPRQESFFRTMTTETFKSYTAAMVEPPKFKQEAAIAAAAKIEQDSASLLRNPAILPQTSAPVFKAPPMAAPVQASAAQAAPPQWTQEYPKPSAFTPAVPADSGIAATSDASAVPAATIPIFPDAPAVPAPILPEAVQEELPMPKEIPWRMVGELYNSYILVEQGDEAYLIDKHAAHERILFEKLKANQERISSQVLLSPVSVRLNPAACGELLANQAMLEELGFEIEEFGDNLLLLRQIPMDLSPDDAADAVETLAANLLDGRREQKDTVRDEILHTVACKAAIKAGWHTDEAELLALVKQVMSRDDLKHCPHGRPTCITLSKKQLEKQFKRS